MVKVTKSIRLPVEVAERLEAEPNQSVAVEEALREKYDL
jgi:predicted DNA-binding protein